MDRIDTTDLPDELIQQLSKKNQIAIANQPDRLEESDVVKRSMETLTDFRKGANFDEIRSKVPKLDMIPVDRIVVDRSYQRDISGKGKSHIYQIAREFDWIKFTPAIVVQVSGEDGPYYAVIDGQHRCTAAKMRNIREIPAQIVDATVEDAALAFAAINGNVIKVTSTEVHHAAVTGGDPSALKIQNVCIGAEVKILKNPPSPNVAIGANRGFYRGETCAVRAIRNSIENYGEEITTLALSCITMSGDGNPGMLIQNVIKACAEFLKRNPIWIKNCSELLDMLDDFAFEIEYENAKARAKEREEPILKVFYNSLSRYCESKQEGKLLSNG